MNISEKKLYRSNSIKHNKTNMRSILAPLDWSVCRSKNIR